VINFLILEDRIQIEHSDMFHQSSAARLKSVSIVHWNNSKENKERSINCGFDFYGTHFKSKS
jgi:hypothetical protein